MHHAIQNLSHADGLSYSQQYDTPESEYAINLEIIGILETLAENTTNFLYYPGESILETSIIEANVLKKNMMRDVPYYACIKLILKYRLKWAACCMLYYIKCASTKTTLWFYP